MAIPSSPPIVAADLPSSPPLPPIAPFQRKRHFTEDDNLSSDPVFSEDGSECDDKPGERRKRTYKGPWWGQRITRQESRKPSKFADSGVWLASETSDDGFMLGPAQYDTDMPVQEQDERGEQHGTPSLMDVCVERSLPTPEQLALEIVLDCVENSREVVDLSDMALKQLSDNAVKPLHQMIRARDMDQPDSDNFISLTPDIQIYLSGNALTSIPNEIWKLENVSVLSVRNNQISEIPGFISSLTRLKELNIAGNGLHWLPWELLDLIRLRQGQILRLITHPNPLWVPVDGACLASQPPVSFANPASVLADHQPSGTVMLESHTPSHITLSSMIARVAATWLARRQAAEDGLSNMAPVFGAATTIRYFDLNGFLLRKYADLPSSSSEAWPADLNASPDLDLSPSPTPSLFDIAGRSIRDHYAEHVASWLANGQVTGPIQHMLEHLQQNRTARLPSCSVCGRQYLFKRAEWVEYWHCNMSGSSVPSHLLFLPFMRRTCSWGCVRVAWCEREATDIPGGD
ncbi:hypothetical protein BDZ85DRAFT_138881 [Elsinoe ampelina]|uniref:Uncharacterized protein n=1 Tax=Elsinoe ampelina TaxID=302913 RepID=A0A6A6G955_9PEZI|nr:hypothetical protein BDZ85DRAFT_138881 [Elsinoe ampelina]